MIPTSLWTAVAASAAAGKNPWLPFGVLLVLGGLDSPPGFIIDAELHAGLHGLMPPNVAFAVGGVFLVLALLDSLADKIPWIESWLTPISSAWRPIAAVAVAALVGVATANARGEATTDQVVAGATAAATELGLFEGATLIVVTTVFGTVFGVLSTIGKVGTRLLLSLVPVPALRVAHSFVDDFFALMATSAGLALADGWVFPMLAVGYLVVGLFTAPLLLRLALIHFRIGWSLLGKLVRRVRGRPPPPPAAPPRWLARALEKEGVSPDHVHLLPAYAYSAPVVGWCRAGYVVFSEVGVWFAVRRLLGPRILRVPRDRIARLGLAETSTSRDVTLVEARPGDGLRDAVVHLFPCEADEVHPVLADGASRASLERVKAESPSARQTLVGFASKGAGGRFVDEANVGSLRLQAVVTLASAIGVGIFTGGLVVPIGAGYLLSPFKRRFVLGLFMTAYLSLCVLGTMGLGWPVTVLYATLLNGIALRDLARQALRAKIEGFVDKRAFLPSVCGHVWVGAAASVSPGDRAVKGEPAPMTDGSWRAVLAVM